MCTPFLTVPGSTENAAGRPDRRRAPRTQCPRCGTAQPLLTCGIPRWVPKAPSDAAGPRNCVTDRCQGAGLRTNVVVVHQGRREGNVMSPQLRRPRPRRRARLPPRGLAGRHAKDPQPARRLVPQPPSSSLTRVTGIVLSEARATIDAVPRWDDAPIVGRADELARLLAHVDRAPAGRRSAVLLAGDAGVGKTRLLNELAARAAERGVRVLIGHCVDLGDVGLPYLPFVDLLRPVAGNPDLARSRRRTRCSPGCSPAARRAAAGRAGARGPRPGPPAAAPGGAAAGRRRPAAAVRVGRRR